MPSDAPRDAVRIAGSTFLSATVLPVERLTVHHDP
jgi:hypothetical protein